MKAANNKKQPIIVLIYALFVVADLLLLAYENEAMRWFTKPILMPLLAVWVWQQSPHLPALPKRILLSALFFSWLGDVLLQAKDMFLPGLFSFLLAHLAYITFFVKTGTGKGQLQKEPVTGLPVIIYVTLFLWLVYPFLNTLRVPVTIYAAVIGCMLLLALNQRGRVHNKAAMLLFNGALQFVLSDSLLAVNLFAFPHKILSLSVMATYAGAQYLMVKGSLASCSTLPANTSIE